jgi:hypothetical protein
MNSVPWSFAHFTTVFGRSIRGCGVKQLSFFGKITFLEERGFTVFGVRRCVIGQSDRDVWRQGDVPEEFFQDNPKIYEQFDNLSRKVEGPITH